MATFNRNNIECLPSNLGTAFNVISKQPIHSSTKRKICKIVFDFGSMALILNIKKYKNKLEYDVVSISKLKHCIEY